MRHIFFCLTALVLVGCGESPQHDLTADTTAASGRFYTEPARDCANCAEAELIELTDAQYPDNPNIRHRHPDRGHYAFQEVRLEPGTGVGEYKIILTPEKEGTPLVTVTLEIEHLFPYAPRWVRENKTLTKYALIQSEWNRVQIAFDQDQFQQGDTALFTRLDIANNCLSAGLWEVILFEQKDGADKVAYHGWFDFPRALYIDLFEFRNEGVDFFLHDNYLSGWVEPFALDIDLSDFGSLRGSTPLAITDRSDKMYPKVGEYETKFPNILWPEEVTSMRDFQTDKTTFATFIPPGIYSKADPRKTELGRLNGTVTATVGERTRLGQSNGKNEWQLTFTDPNGRITRLIYGGLSDQDVLESAESLPFGPEFRRPMGISVAPFYQSYAYAAQHPAKRNNYYCVMLDEENHMLDNHKVGVDGTVLYQKDGLVHLWLLGFERHAPVGHYTWPVR